MLGKKKRSNVFLLFKLGETYDQISNPIRFYVYDDCSIGP